MVFAYLCLICIIGQNRQNFKVHKKSHNICLKAHHYALWRPSWMEGGAVGHNFERDPTRDHPCQVWFNLVQRFQRRRFKCNLLSKYA
jgi:hypothetical protein